MKKKYKKALFVSSLVALALIVFTFLFVSLSGGSDSYNSGDFSDKVAYIDGELVGETSYDVPIFKRLFQGFNFVDLSADFPETGDYLCDLQGSYGSFNHFSGESINSGASCEVGEFIVYRSDGGDIPAGELLFDEVWKKTSTGDLPDFSNYYLDSLDFDYYYACYECSINIEDDFEPGCLNFLKTDCVSESDSDCDIWYGFESVCLTHIGESLPQEEEEEEEEEEE